MVLGFTQIFPWGGETRFKEKVLTGSKLHSIRVDAKRRWHAGRVIQMVTGNRTRQFSQFLVRPCTGVQEITIVFDERGKIEWVIVGKKRVHSYEVIAKNDGLNLLDFEKWFYAASTRGVFKGRVIHWTDLRY